MDYFLASRATNWPVIGLALLATNMSSTALVGLAGGDHRSLAEDLDQIELPQEIEIQLGEPTPSGVLDD